MNESPVTATLGTHMRRRRGALGISQSAAPRAAGVARSTWIAWENDANVPEDFNHVLIERVLRWEPGSVADALAGAEPTPLGEGAFAGEEVLPPDDAFVLELRKMNISNDYRDVLIREYWADRARESQALQEKYRRIARAAEA